MQYINICGFWVLFLLPLFAGCSEDVQKQVVSQAEKPAPVFYNEELSQFLRKNVADVAWAYVVDFTEPVTIYSDVAARSGFQGKEVHGFDYTTGSVSPEIGGRVVMLVQGPPVFEQSVFRINGKNHLHYSLCVDRGTTGLAASGFWTYEWEKPSNVRGEWIVGRLPWPQDVDEFRAAGQFVEFRSDKTMPTIEEKHVFHEVVHLHVKLASPEDIGRAKLETVDNPNGRWEYSRSSLLVAKIKKADGEEKRKLEREQLKWIRRAAEKGHVLAQQSVVNFYDPSSERGVVWGNKLEQYAWTAVLKYRRENVQEDRDGAEIKRILRREPGSADTGDLLAIRNANPSDVGLSAEELSEAKLLAADYIDQYVPTKE